MTLFTSLNVTINIKRVSIGVQWGLVPCKGLKLSCMLFFVSMSNIGLMAAILGNISAVSFSFYFNDILFSRAIRIQKQRTKHA